MCVCVLAAPTVEHLALYIPSVPGTPLALFSFLFLCGRFPALAREQWVSWEEVSVEGASTGFRTKGTQTLGSPAHWLDGKSSQLQELQSLQLYNGATSSLFLASQSDKDQARML